MEMFGLIGEIGGSIERCGGSLAIGAGSTVYKVIYGGSLWRCSGSFLMRHGGSVEAHCVH